MKRVSATAEWIILAIIAIRPSLDFFSGEGFRVGSAQLNPAVIVSVLAIGSGVLWFVGLDNQTRKKIFSSSSFPIIFLVWVLILFFWALMPLSATYINGKNSLIGIREWVRLLSIFTIFIVAHAFAQKGEARKVLYSVLLSLAIPALLGLYQIAFHKGLLVRGVHRVNSTFVHPNPFSCYLVVMIGVTYWHWRWISQKIWFSLLLLIEFGLLLATYSFTGIAMLAAFGGTLVMGESKTIRITAVSLLLLFALVFVATPTGRQRIAMELKLDQLDYIEKTHKETSSFTWRLLNWRFLYREWKKSPVFGYGLNTSKLVNPMIKKEEGTGFDPHNDYVRYLTETGLVGLALFLSLMASAGFFLWKSYKESTIPASCGYILVALAICISWMVGSMNDNLISATGYQYILWPVLAVAYAGAKNLREESPLL